MADSGLVAESTEQKAVSEKVVSAVAEEKDSDPLALEPLYSVIDPEALNAVFGYNEPGFGRSEGRIEFTYSGCDVTVTTDGEVRVSTSDRGLENAEKWR